MDCFPIWAEGENGGISSWEKRAHQEAVQLTDSILTAWKTAMYSASLCADDASSFLYAIEVVLVNCDQVRNAVGLNGLTASSAPIPQIPYQDSGRLTHCYMIHIFKRP